jgi:TPR repeat protein
MFNKQINSKNTNYIIQNFNKINIKEIEPTSKNIDKYINDDLNIIVDELVNLIFKEYNIGNDTILIKQQVLDYINNQMITLRQIYIGLLNNQNNSNSICLLGYFKYHGIETDLNKQKAIELYQKAAKLENKLAQLNFIDELFYVKDIKKDPILAFELSKKLAEEGYACGMYNLGLCYENGFGTNFDGEKAFESYQKAADLGNYNGIINLGWCYIDGIGTDINNEQAFKLHKNAADLGSVNGMRCLGWCYYEGIGTDVNKEKAFELYQKAANLGNDIAQCDLALMYQIGDGIKKDIDQAIHWYKKAAAQGNKCAQNKLKELLKK